MKRPFLIRITPYQYRISVWSRLYDRNNDSWFPNKKWLPLYEAAPLFLAPGVVMSVVPGDWPSDCIAFTGMLETELSQRVIELGRKGGTMVDIGANLGYFPLLWSASNPDNKCVAIEASPRNFEVLHRNIKLNHFEDRVEVIGCAAGKEAGKFHFNLGPEAQRGWGGLSLEHGARTVEVDVVRADAVIHGDEPIALLKVDTEGADAWALMGCEGLLKSKRVEEIWFEQNKPRSRALGIPDNAAQEFLLSMGYISQPKSDINHHSVEWVATRA